MTVGVGVGGNVDNAGANEGEISGGDVTGAKMGEDAGSMVGEEL